MFRAWTKIAAGLLAGAGAAALSLLSGQPASGVLHDHSVLYWMAVAAVVAAAGLPLVVSGVTSLWLAPSAALVARMDYVARKAWFDLCRDAEDYSLDDVGVHVFVARRSRLLPWRRVLERVARIAKPERQPDPRHARWKPGVGVVGTAYSRAGHDSWDLTSPRWTMMTEPEWEDVRRRGHTATRGLGWGQFERTRTWFSGVWATAVVAADRPRPVAVISANIEREVDAGYSKLDERGARAVLAEAAALAATYWIAT